MCPADGRARKFKKKSTIETARIQIAYIIQSTKKKETRHTDPFNNSKFLILPAVEFETSSYSLSLCFTNSVEKQREKDGITARGEREMRTVYWSTPVSERTEREREMREFNCNCASARPAALRVLADWRVVMRQTHSLLSLSPLLKKKPPGVNQRI